MPEHEMNPFWFVPFRGSRAPARFTPQEWGLLDETGAHRPRSPDSALLTGRIRLRVRTLSHTHITGRVDADPVGPIKQRHLYRRPRHKATGEAIPVIDASSLRGMLRSYMEALTSAPISVWNAEYAKEHKGRHKGFWVGPVRGKDREKFAAVDRGRHVYGDRGGPHPALPDPEERFFPREDLGERSERGTRIKPLDPVAILFGTTGGKREEEEHRQAEQDGAVRGIAGRVRFTDAWFPVDTTPMKHSLDLKKGKALMGGPKPNRSSWWYFRPGGIPTRHVRTDRRTFEVAEFVGSTLRGRKFYFHQDPERCVGSYLRDRDWKRLLAKVRTEVIPAGSCSEPVDICFRDLPRSLVQLLLVALFPSCKVRHQVGALRAFGFGSVSFELEAIELDDPSPAALCVLNTAPLHDRALEELARGSDPQQRELALFHADKALADPHAWRWLRRICTWHELRIAFRYPPFKSRERPAFGNRPIHPKDLPDQASTVRFANRAQQLGRAPDLDVYQKSARTYHQLCKRIETHGPLG